MLKNKYTLLLVLSLYCPFSYNLSIICDLGGVLIETHFIRAIVSVGIEKFTYYASTWQNPFACNKILYDFLESIQPHQKGDILVKDAHGLVIPPLMCDWLKGSISSTTLLHTIKNARGTFKSWSQELLVRALAETIFDPYLFSHTRFFSPEGIHFIKNCKKDGHQVYALSNWDPESFSVLEQQYPDFFNLFDGIVISGDCQLLKPDPAIYRFLLETYQLDPAECFFIDDQKENVQAAEHLGIKSILYSKQKGLFRSSHNFDFIQKKIKNYHHTRLKHRESSHENKKSSSNATLIPANSGHIL